MTYRDRTPRLSAPTEVEVSKPSMFLGAPTQLTLRRVIEGRTEDETLETIVRMLPSRLGKTGEVMKLAGEIAFTYHPQGWSSYLTVRVASLPDRESTQVTLIADYDIYYSWPFVNAVFACVLVVALGPLGAPPWGLFMIAIFVALVVTYFVVGRILRQRIARNRAAVETIGDLIAHRNAARREL